LHHVSGKTGGNADIAGGKVGDIARRMEIGDNTNKLTDNKK